MSAQNDLAPPLPAPSGHLRVLGFGCPAWCVRGDCSSGHVSRAESLAPQADAAVVSTRLLVLDDGGRGSTALSLVSLGVQHLELDDKPTVELLPGEARRLAAALLRLADLAEAAAEPAPAARRPGPAQARAGGRRPAYGP